MGKKRDFGRVERFVWQDPRFHELGPDGKMAFLYLLTAPGSFRVPGLVRTTPLIMAEDLHWVEEAGGDYGTAVSRAQAALERCIDHEWACFDPKAKLVYLPKAVGHELPDNANVVKGWLRVLHREVPPSPLRRAWILGASATFRRAFGSDDSRTTALRNVINYQNKIGTSDGQIPETIEEQQTVPHTHGETVGGITSNSSSNSRSISRKIQGSLLDTEKAETNHNAGGAGSPPAAARLPAGKPEAPPGDFDQRQLEVWEALRTAAFYVPGVGDQTAWENVKDPVRLARQLGGPGYPNVDVGLVYRLASWTQENRARAKRQIGRFLLNRFSQSQERGGRGGTPQPARSPGRAPASADLAAKVRGN